MRDDVDQLVRVVSRRPVGDVFHAVFLEQTHGVIAKAIMQRFDFALVGVLSGITDFGVLDFPGVSVGFGVALFFLTVAGLELGEGKAGLSSLACILPCLECLCILVSASRWR